MTNGLLNCVSCCFHRVLSICHHVLSALLLVLKVSRFSIFQLFPAFLSTFYSCFSFFHTSHLYFPITLSSLIWRVFGNYADSAGKCEIQQVFAGHFSLPPELRALSPSFPAITHRWPCSTAAPARLLLVNIGGCMLHLFVCGSYLQQMNKPAVTTLYMQRVMQSVLFFLVCEPNTNASNFF